MSPPAPLGEVEKFENVLKGERGLKNFSQKGARSLKGGEQLEKGVNTKLL